MKRYVYIFLLVLFTSSCISRSITHKGNIFDNNDVESIRVGLTDKNDILHTFGYPLNISYFDKNIWIYYSYQMKEILFFKPYISDQKVLVIRFNNDTNVVSDMYLYNIDSNNYEILNTTDTSLQDNQNVIQDILSNIGQISM